MKFALPGWNEHAFIVNNRYLLPYAYYVPSILQGLLLRFSHFTSILTVITQVYTTSIPHPDYYDHLLTNHIPSLCTKRAIWNTPLVHRPAGFGPCLPPHSLHASFSWGLVIDPQRDLQVWKLRLLSPLLRDGVPETWIMLINSQEITV